MKLFGFIFIYENLHFILIFIILSIPFYIMFYKSKNSEFNSEKVNRINKKNLFLNRIDIIGNKVYIIIFIILSKIVYLVRFLF